MSANSCGTKSDNLYYADFHVILVSNEGKASTEFHNCFCNVSNEFLLEFTLNNPLSLLHKKAVHKDHLLSSDSTTTRFWRYPFEF